MQGFVVLEALITAIGCVDALSVLRSPDPLLGLSSMWAVSGWRFTPTTLDEVPVPCDHDRYGELLTQALTSGLPLPAFFVVAFIESDLGVDRFLLLAPLFYAVLGYGLTALACVVYNFMAKRIGNIEFTTSAEGP